ncbi:MAG: hypothetical protein ONB51_05575 [candidate division KSB1 bacterium]|nr:hypothetical protein [candidate division KSB1 bacterium]MDZ7354015.1 hypothetical protein [candidate division KSB1 bacterium]MDZ7408695.1 hypothetical protein [candidate division KSB1 bacterium]
MNLNFACGLAVPWNKWRAHKAPSALPFEVKQGFFSKVESPHLRNSPVCQTASRLLSHEMAFSVGFMLSWADCLCLILPLRVASLWGWLNFTCWFAVVRKKGRVKCISAGVERTFAGKIFYAPPPGQLSIAIKSAFLAKGVNLGARFRFEKLGSVGQRGRRCPTRTEGLRHAVLPS